MAFNTEIEGKSYKKINFYPLILVFMGIFGTINEIIFFFKKDQMGYENPFLNLLNSLSLHAMGFLNAIVYSNTPAIRDTIKYDIFKCFFGNQEDILVSENTNTTLN